MIFTYRASGIDPQTQKVRNVTRKIDTDDWLMIIKREPMYRGTSSVVERDLLPLLESDSLDELASCVHALYDTWRYGAGTAIFELAMFVWAKHKRGECSARVWATVLGFTWQAGVSGMLAAVKLSTNQVVEMFNAAPKEVLFNVMSKDKGEDSTFEAYKEMADTMVVYRGVSTGMSHQENGFSWSLDIEQARDFSLRNCHTKKEAPGILIAEIRKDAILCAFDYESEIVVNPLIPKKNLQKLFLEGKALKEFHKRFDASRYLTDAVHPTSPKKQIFEM